MDTGKAIDGLLRAALRLAKIDAVYRAGPRTAAGIVVEPPDGAVADLRTLWDVMRDGDLAGLRPPMLLNPDFGDASDLVGGADADIIADGVLIEIKTDVKPTFQLKHFRQLAGYAALQRMARRPDFRRWACT